MAAQDDKKNAHPEWLCEECGSGDVSITPVPGLWLQFWCNSCDHWWWMKEDGTRAAPTSASDTSV